MKGVKELIETTEKLENDIKFLKNRIELIGGVATRAAYQLIEKIPDAKKTIQQKRLMNDAKQLWDAIDKEKKNAPKT